jgi:hypothetical protein
MGVYTKRNVLKSKKQGDILEERGQLKVSL